MNNGRLFIVDIPINSMVIFHSYVNVYQRVTRTKTMFFGGFNSEKYTDLTFSTLVVLSNTGSYLGNLEMSWHIQADILASKYWSTHHYEHSTGKCVLWPSQKGWFIEVSPMSLNHPWVPIEVCSASWSKTGLRGWIFCFSVKRIQPTMWGVYEEHVCSVKELTVWNP